MAKYRIRNPKTRIHVHIEDRLDDAVRALVTSGTWKGVSAYINEAVREKLTRDAK